MSRELALLRKAFHTFLRRFNDRTRERELLLLLGHPSSDVRHRRRFATTEDPNERLDELDVQVDSAGHSNRLVEQMKDVGAHVLDMLRAQRDTLVNTRARLVDLGVMLGVSRSTMNYIDTRLRLDKWIVYCGMLMVTLLLVFVWYWKFT